MPNRSIISVSICIALHMLKTNVCHITFYRRLTKWIFYVLLPLLWKTFSEIFLSESTLNSIKCIKLTRITKIVWEKLDRNPDWTVIMIKYICICVFFFLQKYLLMKKSTFSVIVQYHFQISVLQHCEEEC